LFLVGGVVVGFGGFVDGHRADGGVTVGFFVGVAVSVEFVGEGFLFYVVGYFA
jgi:hypothetical protein